jgi:methylmalonyl-CoA/ethylmalonyl-CoA epimerase
MIEGLSLHHVGVACRDIVRSEQAYSAVGYSRVSEFRDPRLGVHGIFLEGAGPRLELLADLPGARVIGPWLAREAAMYHLAFEVVDLPAAIAAARDGGAKIVTQPTPAVAFGGRLIAFVMLRNMALVELISTRLASQDNP